MLFGLLPLFSDCAVRFSVESDMWEGVLEILREKRCKIVSSKYIRVS